jgi:hypothetical protein
MEENVSRFIEEYLISTMLIESRILLFPAKNVRVLAAEAVRFQLI